MLGEVNLTHTTSAEQALNNVASEDLTVVQRHVRKPTNDKANAYKERGHQKAKDSEGMLAPITESMLIAIWHMGTNGCLYDDPGADYFNRLHPQRAKTRAIHQLESMGYQVTLTHAS